MNELKTIDDAFARIRESVERRLEIRKSKAHDYASEENWLENFERRAELFNILKPDMTTPQGIAFWDVVMKTDRFANLVFAGKTPKNESLNDTLDDWKNYIDLMEECLVKREVIK